MHVIKDSNSVEILTLKKEVFEREEKEDLEKWILYEQEHYMLVWVWIIIAKPYLFLLISKTKAYSFNCEKTLWCVVLINYRMESIYLE